jgi:hypothetical protein
MKAMIRRLRAMGVICAVVAGVWTLGAVKADLDGPFKPTTQVDPIYVQRARLAEERAAAAEAKAARAMSQVQTSSQTMYRG